MEKKCFFFSSLLFILKNLFIEKIFKWLPKMVYWLLADFKRKKYLGNTIKKNLRQYILQYCHCKSLTSSRWFTSFFVGYYTVKLIGSVVYCLNIFRPKLSCENVLACHMPDKHMPGEFLPAFLLTNLFPPLPWSNQFFALSAQKDTCPLSLEIIFPVNAS